MASEEKQGNETCGLASEGENATLQEIVSAHFTEVEERLGAVHAQVLALLSGRSEALLVDAAKTGAAPSENTTEWTCSVVPGETHRQASLESSDTQSLACSSLDPVQFKDVKTQAAGGSVRTSNNSSSLPATRLSGYSACSDGASVMSDQSEEFDGAGANAGTAGLMSETETPWKSGEYHSEHSREPHHQGSVSNVRFQESLPDIKTFELVQVWTKRRGKHKSKRSDESGQSSHSSSDVRHAIQYRHSHSDTKELDTYVSVAEENESRSLFDIQRWILHPQCGKRLFWDTFTLILVSFDIVFLPLQLLEIEDNTFTDALAWTGRLFWTCDIGASFLTGNIKRDGTIVMQPRKIVYNYITTWLCMDICIVTSDWVDYLYMTGNPTAYARMGKATRGLRMIKLLRLLKIRNQFDILLEGFQSEYVHLVIGMCKIMFVLLAFAHILACLWYGLSRSHTGTASWVLYYKYAEESIELRYMAALHWSISQFTGGMDEFVPQNLDERIFAICAFLLGFILSAIFVSSITSSMTQLNILASADALKLRHLRRYMIRNKIPQSLAMRVQRSAEQSIMHQQKFMPESEVSALSNVSKPLLVEVHFALHSGLLHIHSLFDRYIAECPHVMKKICHVAISVQHSFTGEILFHAGETPQTPKMYIICSGTMQYLTPGRGDFSGRRHLLRHDTWCSEANLWVDFTHQGELKAIADCRACVIDARAFQDITSTFDQLEFDPSIYAAVFLKNLNRMAATGSEQDPVALDLMPPPNMYEEVLIAENSVSRTTRPSFIARASVMNVLGWHRTSDTKRQATPSGDAEDAMQGGSEHVQPTLSISSHLAVPGTPRGSRGSGNVVPKSAPKKQATKSRNKTNPEEAWPQFQGLEPSALGSSSNIP